MKVLHINKSDIAGGAAIAAYRLHSGLLTQGIDSNIVVDIKRTKDRKVISLARQRLSDELISRATQFCGLNYINILGSKRLISREYYQTSAILNFHTLTIFLFQN